MTAFTLPLVIEAAETAGPSRIRRVPIALRVPGPVPWDRVERVVRTAAGLAERTELYLGVGRVEPDWMVGAPPLLAGVTLSTRPASEIPVAAAITLAVCAGPDAGQAVALDARGVIIGRAPDADLTVDDPGVSARHARVSICAAGLEVVDLGSTNGAWIDGRRLPGGSLDVGVPADSLIRLGGSLLRAGLATEPRIRTVPDGRGHLLVHRVLAPPTPDPPSAEPPPPPPHRPRRPIPVLAGVISAGLGVLLAVILRSWIYLAVAAIGPLTMLATGLGDAATGRRRHRRDLREHERATADWRQSIRAASRTRRDAQWERYPDPSTLLRRATQVRVGLWSRSREDCRRLCSAVGVGASPGMPTGAPEDTDPERGSAADTPLGVDLAQLRVLGLVGHTGPLLRFLMMQAVCLLAPADLRLAVFSAREELAGWQDLPHAVSATGAVGNPGITGGIGSAHQQADLLVIVDDAARWRSDPAVAALLRMAAQGPGPSGRRVVAVCTARQRADLPAECSSVLELRSGRVRAVQVPDSAGGPDVSAESHLIATGISRSLATQAFSALAALIDSGDTARIPVSVGFGDLQGRLDAAAVRGRWASPTVVARIGMAAGGAVGLDLDRDGPHLLVAGTTGSGKSELLQTLVAGLAMAAPPDRMSFLLVDYKGGAAFAALSGLPHVTAVITDLDGSLGARALTSLRSELRRRERLAATGAGAVSRLVIVVDEFAALASDQPTFLAGLVDIAQRGRSLGLHLVLATQRPAGVVSPAIRANTAARICLRVTDPADSLDVVGSPAAAAIPADLPGRALLWTGGRHPVPFQTARVSAPFDPAVVAWRRELPHPAAVRSVPDMGRHRQVVSNAWRGTAEEPAAVVTELDRLVEATVEAAHGLDRPAPPWLPPLPPRIEPGMVEDAVVAMVDRPELQCRQSLLLDVGSVLVVGDPRSGRTTALARLAAGATARGTRLAIIDPRGDLVGGWHWPTADTVLDASDPALVGRLLDLLTGVPPPGGYRESILLVIDGWEDVTAALDAADQGMTTARLLRLVDAAPAGVRVAVSGRRPLQHHTVGQRVTHLLELADGREGAAAGRGRYRGDEIQIVLPPRQPSRGEDPGEHPPPARVVVRPLPAAVGWQELPRARPAAVLLGRGGDAAEPIGVDLTGPGGAWLVGGTRRSGVSTALLVLGLGAATAGIPVIWAGPIPANGRPRHGDLGDTPWRAVTDTDQLDAALATHQGPMLLIADLGTGAPAEPRSRPGSGCWDPETAADLLARFCRVCGPGQFLALGARSEVMAASFRGPIAEALTFRRAILLGADPADGLRLGVRLPRRWGPPTPGRGFLVQQGLATPLQVAQPPGTGSDLGALWRESLTPVDDVSSS